MELKTWGPWTGSAGKCHRLLSSLGDAQPMTLTKLA